MVRNGHPFAILMAENWVTCLQRISQCHTGDHVEAIKTIRRMNLQRSSASPRRNLSLPQEGSQALDHFAVTCHKDRVKLVRLIKLGM